MRIYSPLFKAVSPQQMCLSIDWIQAASKYVLIDPNTNNTLLYVPEGRYLKMISTAAAADKTYIVLAVPGDTKATCFERNDVPASSGTPPQVPWGPKSPKLPKGYRDYSMKNQNFSDEDQNRWRNKLSRLLPILKGWIVKNSMISFKRNFEAFLPTYYRTVLNWLGIRNNPFLYKKIWILSNQIAKTFKSRGIGNTILVLKISLICLNQYLAGTPMQNTQSLGQRVRLIHGLPAFIPAPFRNHIRRGHIGYIRCFTTLLGCYKGLQGTYKSPDLSSITAPTFFRESIVPKFSKANVFGSLFERYENYEPERVEDWSEVKNNVTGFFRVHKIDLYPDLSCNTDKLPLWYPAGPNHKISMFGAYFDALAHIYNDPNRLFYNLNRHIVSYQKSKRYPLETTVYDRMLLLEKELTAKLKSEGLWAGTVNMLSVFKLKNICYTSRLTPEWEKATLHARFPNGDTHIRSKDLLLKWVTPYLELGKLAIKHEAAGKVRIFAIVDYWSQWALEPLHKALFRVLRNIPMDATFDQLGKVAEFRDRKYSFVASFDIKSATDLIPLRLYILVLGHFLNPDLAKFWAEFLTKRNYIYKIPKGDFKDGEKPYKYYKYTRGQPMGALSSWASLALIHHFIVYLSARRADIEYFTDYLVLGDDIIIANQQVAAKYLEVCKDYGITISIPKSYVSNNGFFQFASQDVMGEINVSPIALKEVLSIAGNSYYFGPDFHLSKRQEFIQRMLNKGFIGNNLSSMLRVQSTRNDWLRISKALTKGIFPKNERNLIVSLLLSQDWDNNLVFSQFMASLRGDISCFTKTMVYRLPEVRTFVEQLVSLLSDDITDTIDRAKDQIHEQFQPELDAFIGSSFEDRWEIPRRFEAGPLQDVDWFNNNGDYHKNIKFQEFSSYCYRIPVSAASTHYMDNLTLLNEMSKESSKLLETHMANITQDNWDVLYFGEERNLSVFPQVVKDLLKLRTRLSSLAAKQEVSLAMASDLDTKLPYNLRVHFSLLSQMSYLGNRRET